MKIEEKELPKGWEVKNLGEVCDIQTGKYDANHAKSAGKFRFYTCAFDHMFCDTNRFKGKSIILPGNGANVGEVFYFDGEFDAYQRTYVLNNFDKVYSKFLFYHLLCYWRKLNQDKQFGSATNYIRMGNFTDYEVPIPPLPEQQQIVAKIEELFSELENGKKELLIAQAKLKTYRQSLLKWAFEGRLTNKNLKANELPKSWEVKNLGEVCDMTSGGTPSRKNEKFYSGNIPWVKSGELDKGLILDTEEKITEEAIKNSSAKIFPRGTLLIALYGATIGKLAFLGIDAATNQAVCGIFLNKKINSSYLFNFLSFKKSELVSQGIGGAQPNISQGILKNLKIPLPPLPEQQKIVAILESKLTICDAIEETIKTSIKQGEALRQSILKKAFEGKLINKKNVT